jgi:hypothetical protein
MILDPYDWTGTDPDTDPDWQGILDSIESYRITADRRGEPHDPEWDEWEAEAKAEMEKP